jgi:quinol monooxygenase YgiN
MILVTAAARSRPETRDDLSRRLARLAAASRDEPGCRGYRFTCDVEDPTLFSSFEMWDDRAAHDAHMAAPHVLALLDVLGDLVTAAPVITVHDVASSGPYG